MTHPLMARALTLAERAMTIASPNPRVGCVIAAADGKILGEGHTQQAGGAHAEVMALHDAQQKGLSVRGATAYVTLEPCSHHGRTGPCCFALEEAGIARVVAAITDPNPLVAGNGLKRLKEAGVAVELGAGAVEARRLNIGFFSRMQRQRPWVRMKIAASLDGITALADGRSQWITSAESRADGHAWRARACAILTGGGTALADNPRLDVREFPTERQPHVVLVDSALDLSPDAKLLIPDRRVLIYTANASAHKRAALETRGATVMAHFGFDGRVDLAAMMHDLAQVQEINELHLEAGERLNGALLQAGLVDELLVYLAPKMLGAGKSMATLCLPPDLSGIALTVDQVDKIGPDIRVLARTLAGTQS